MESVLWERNGEIATIYLNEPNTLNALSAKLKEELLGVLKEIENDNSISVVILTGKGRAFCTGGDLKGMAKLEQYDPITVKRGMELSTSIIEKIWKWPKITIAAIHGYTAGAGFSLALASDLIIAEEDTKLILSFKNVGLIPDLGIHYHLPRIVGEWKAKEWIWKGIKMTVEEAVSHGFSIEIVPKGSLEEKSMELANELLTGPLQAYMYSKLLINQSTNMKLEDILAKENDIHTILRATNDFKEGVTAFLEKRNPKFSGN